MIVLFHFIHFFFACFEITLLNFWQPLTKFWLRMDRCLFYLVFFFLRFFCWKLKKCTFGVVGTYYLLTFLESGNLIHKYSPHFISTYHYSILRSIQIFFKENSPKKFTQLRMRMRSISAATTRYFFKRRIIEAVDV